VEAASFSAFAEAAAKGFPPLVDELARLTLAFGSSSASAASKSSTTESGAVSHRASASTWQTMVAASVEPGM
jgi:hypothetical protein